MEELAGDDQPLTLFTRETHPTIAHHEGMAIGQGIDENSDICLTGCVSYALHRQSKFIGIASPQRNVLGDATVEDHGLLRHMTNSLPPTGQLNLSARHTIAQYSALS